jgi:4-amino-4-deoxy-L-arabinose transferase-like glycosyltransferase
MTADRARSLKRFWLPVAIVLAIHAALGISAAAHLTATHDEYWHLPVGLLNLKTGRFDYENLNPPLCRIMAAAPLLFTSAVPGGPPTDPGTNGFGDSFIAANGPHYDTWYLLGRTMVVLISVLGGLVTAVWARELFGDGAGCLAAVFWAFEPNLIAHGSLVTTDMGAAAFFVFALFAVWKFAARPNWKWALIFGGVLGLAQLAKFTSLLLYPIAIVEFVLLTFAAKERAPSGQKPEEQTRSVGKLCGLWILALATSLLVLNAGYLFRGSFSSLRSYDLQSATLRGLTQRLAPIGWMPVPFPRDFIEGIDHQRRVMEQQHPVYLDGQWSVDGIPHYYLWGLFYKLPHPLQILVLATLIWLILPGTVPRRPLTQIAILLPALAMIAMAESSTMQLGIRYVLPAIPFLILFGSQAALWFDLKTFPLRAVTTSILVGWMLLSVRYHPDQLAYFNEWAGGPLGGREHLLDSNLDWGQDLNGLQAYLREHNSKDIGLAYFGTVPPAALGISYHIPPSRMPQPGQYAISVNFEQGRPHWVRTPKGEIRPVDIGEFEYFRFFEPVARIGYSIDVFDLTPQDIERWRTAARAAGLGR